MKANKDGNVTIVILVVLFLIGIIFVLSRFDFSGERRLDDVKESAIYFRIKDACVAREKNLLKIPEGKTIEETYGLPVAKQIGEKCSKEADAEAERQTP